MTTQKNIIALTTAAAAAKRGIIIQFLVDLEGMVGFTFDGFDFR